jgi:2'-5' RNA ligase
VGRFFFALWPDEDAAQSLAALSESIAAQAGGKPVPRERIHLTLAFLGELAPARAEEACNAAAVTGSRGFELVLDQLGSFRAARVAWAGCSHGPPGLKTLQTRLAKALVSRDFVLEERPFAAHVTLARKISKALEREPMPPIVWRAREYTLVRSEAGTGRYTVLERWNLG